MVLAYLCLGSNKGDRVGYIQQATSLLGAVYGIKLISTSSLYETQPWHEQETAWFVNAVIEIKTSLSPQDLLIQCQRIEKQLGRDRDKEGVYGARTIDIDILFYNNQIVKEDNLQIPHKYFHERAFAIVPMLEINPYFVHPELKKNLSQLHEELENPEMVYLYGTRIDEL